MCGNMWNYVKLLTGRLLNSLDDHQAPRVSENEAHHSEIQWEKEILVWNRRTRCQEKGDV